ncbi:MAG: riboflavin synthase [Phycisphaerales bacterium]|nr:riboflavin synthase [Phycisphaerales bacterium]
MFSGIIEQKGTVVSFGEGVEGARRLRVHAGALAGECPLGASVAVSGVCLTVAQRDGGHLEFDVVAETQRRTMLGGLRAGGEVNLERSLRVGDRLDGHFVQGHIDALATVARVGGTAGEHLVGFRGDAELMRCMIAKGSVAIDGVSLTLAEVTENEFSVTLIPTTLRLTTLGALRTGDRVNIETDILVRTILATLSRISADGPVSQRTTTATPITLARLVEAGFA